MAVAESVAPGEKLEVSAHYLGPDYSIELEQEPSEYVGFEPHGGKFMLMMKAN